MKNNNWVKYKNGNYMVYINMKNGTKIRETEDDEFIAKFPECMDVKITNHCDMNCKMCHEDSTINGKHGELNVEFIDTLNPYAELALGGGNPLSHPNLRDFLEKCKERKLIVNMTINQKHFMEQQEYIKELIDNKLIKGLGISLTNATDEFVENVLKYRNIVIHVINGMVELSSLEKMYGKGIKILILGYKQFRRGIENFNCHSDNINKLQNDLYDNLQTVINNLKVVSFDNLAIEQLNVKRLMSEEEWEEFYMGDDGNFTMYIDLVKQEFARSSISEKRYKLLDNIEDMFRVIKTEK